MIDLLHRSDLWRRTSRFLFLLVLLVLIGHFVVYLHYAIGLMRFPFDYDQGEGFELVDTVLFSRGDWPYRSNEVYPFYASNYPPLFHVILVPFVWVFGPEYWYGRLAGLVGTLITAAAIGYAVFREGRHRQIAAISGLAFLASNYVYHVGPLFRQHMAMVLFETLSVVVLAHVAEIEESRRRRRTMIAGLMLLLAAGYTKQLAAATAIAVFVFLFLRNPRQGILWGALFGAVGGAIFVWINWATGGEWWANIVAANINQYIPAQFVDLFKQWFRLHSVLIVMAGLFATYELYFARLSLYSIWWVLAVGNTVLSGKWGAGDSYFTTAIAASCLLAGIFAARTVRGEWMFPADHPFVRRLGGLRVAVAERRTGLVATAGIVIPLLYLYYGVSVIHLPTTGPVFGPLSDALGLKSSYGDRYAFYDAAGWVPGYATIGHVPTQADRANGWRIVDILRASELPAMSEEAGFSLRAGKDVVTNPTQLKNLYENQMFDPARLVEAIRAHDFGVVVFRAQFYPPPVLEAVYEAYYPAETILMNGFNYEIWRPGPPQAEREAFAAALFALAPGGTYAQTLTLPFDAAPRWLAHALTHQGWQWHEGSQASADPGGCWSWAYRQADRSLVARVCPARPGTELTLTGEGA